MIPATPTETFPRRTGRQAFPVRAAIRRTVAAVTRRLPSVRGLGRLVLAADRLLTDSDDPASFEVSACVNGHGHLILDLRTWEQKFAFYYGTYEPELIAATGRLFCGGVFYDIGASIGLYAVPMALTCQQHGGYVRAFEPVPQNRQRLEGQIAENSLSTDLVRMENVALGSESGTAMMDLCDDGKPGNAKITGGGQVSVEVTTLDAVWAAREHEHIDFIKIDTEGWDARILAGGKAAIRKCRPNMLIEFNRERMTNHGIPLAPAWTFLVDEMDYHVFSVSERGSVSQVHEPGDLENLFFVRAEDVGRLG
ncbi:MAG: FkbM family methyltransferase [Fuerstiella sp.]